MSDRIIKDVNIKCDKCGKDIRFKVYYNKDKESNVYCKSNLDDVDICSCVGAYKQYSDEYKNMDMEIEE